MLQFKRLGVVGGSWFDLAKLFLTKNVKVFFLVVLKAAVRTYYLFFKYWWPLMTLYIILEFLYYFRVPFLLIGVKSVCMAVWLVLIFLLYLAARPSVAKKDYGYYKNYFIQMILFIFVLMGLQEYINEFVVWNCSLVFFVLFWLDSGRFVPLFKTFYRTIFLIVCTLPFCFLYMLAFNKMFYFVVGKCFELGMLLPMFVRLFVIVFLPIQLALLVSLYTKMVYNSYSYYYWK